MAFAADQTRLSQQSNARSGPIVRFIVHHQAATDDDATIGAMVSGSRQVSATWTVASTGRVTSVVPEGRRPWTSASIADDGALTVEVANSTGAPEWGIDPRSFEACARLIAYGHLAYGIPLRHATADDTSGVLGHREVLPLFGDGYPTACPGNLDIDQLITRAAELVANPASIGGALSEEDDFMSALSYDEQRRVLDFVDKNAVDTSGQGLTMRQQLVNLLTGTAATGNPDVDSKSGVLSLLLRTLGPIELTNSAVGQLLGRPVGGAAADVDEAEVAKLVVQMLGADLAAKVAPLLTVVAKDAA